MDVSYSSSSEEEPPKPDESSSDDGSLVNGKRPASPGKRCPESKRVKQGDFRLNFDKKELEKLVAMAEKSRWVVPCVRKREKLCDLTDAKNVKFDSNNAKYRELASKIRSVNHSRRKKRNNKGDSNEICPGEWVVESIVDAGLTDDGNILYLVKWEGWAGSDSWEPPENLGNCRALVRQYHINRQKLDERAVVTKLIDLCRVLGKILAEDDTDIGLLLKLSGKRINEFTHSRHQISELKAALRAKCRHVLYYVYRRPAGMDDHMLLDATCKALKLKERFGSLNSFFKFVDKRSKSKKIIESFEEEINDYIYRHDDGPEIRFENLVDEEVPNRFKYTHKYVFDKEIIHYDDTPVIHCDCRDGCGSNWKRCCVKECHSRPYNEHGTLLQNPQTPIYECNEKCKCGSDCPFKVVTKGRKIKLAVFRTEDSRGWGLKTLETIPKGKFVITYMGELITTDEADIRNQNRTNDLNYLMDLDYNPDTEAIFTVDAEHQGNLSRYINHSCSPNLTIHPCWGSNMDVNMPIIAFFTIRKVLKGEELTFDYNPHLGDAYRNEKRLDQLARAEKAESENSGDESHNDNDTQGEKLFPVTTPEGKISYNRKCHCGAPNCRLVMM
ncbi:Histone-lysine N-methyltransferase SUV39H1 [Halotydeus destructor]|nr:Histone-lysine N-methyltransferase SUV39H1 [Halotydeus destructor]